MRLGIDIDGVITDFEGYWVEEASKHDYVRGKKVIYIPQYGLEKAYGYRDADGNLLFEGEKEFIKELFLGYAKAGSVRKYASEVLHKLHDKGHKIIIVTKRHYTYRLFGWREEDAKQEVLNFLNKHNIYYDNIVFASDNGNKREECESLNLDVLLDDCPDVVNELYGSRTRPILLGCMFNGMVNNVLKVYSWYEFLYKIDEMCGDIHERSI